MSDPAQVVAENNKPVFLYALRFKSTQELVTSVDSFDSTGVVVSRVKKDLVDLVDDAMPDSVDDLEIVEVRIEVTAVV